MCVCVYVGMCGCASVEYDFQYTIFIEHVRMDQLKMCVGRFDSKLVWNERGESDKFGSNKYIYTQRKNIHHIHYHYQF